MDKAYRPHLKKSKVDDSENTDRLTNSFSVNLPTLRQSLIVIVSVTQQFLTVQSGIQNHNPTVN